MSMTKDEFEEGLWELNCLMLQALIRKLKADEDGEPMKAAELSPVNNFIKFHSPDAPDESFNRVFDDEG